RKLMFYKNWAIFGCFAGQTTYVLTLSEPFVIVGQVDHVVLTGSDLDTFFRLPHPVKHLRPGLRPKNLDAAPKMVFNDRRRTFARVLS
ncbi:MAG: hypothetical protein ACUVSU_09810, partial [Aggregatilineaceae bacterium]